MFGFSFGNRKILGIDIGTSNLKMVELEIRDGKKPYLSNYAWMSVPEVIRSQRNDDKLFGETVPKLLTKMYKKAKFEAKEAYVAIPSFGGLVTLIEIPAMPEEDMEQAIRFEAHKYIPTSLDEVNVSWEIIDDDELQEEKDKIKEGLFKNSKGGDGEGGANTEGDSKKKIKVLLAAAFKNKISDYEKIVSEAGIKLKGMEIESISMASALIGNDPGSFIVIDIGSSVCNMIYVKNGIIRANRNIDAGGADITRAIAKGMGIDEERAEGFKVSGRNFFSQESSLRFSVLDMISSEVSRILEVAAHDGQDRGVENIILSGGTAKLFGLTGYFENRFKIKTIIGDPFKRLAYDNKNEVLTEKMKSDFAVCIGLALKDNKE